MALKPGQPIPRSAVMWNNVIESADAFTGTKRLGEPGVYQTDPNPTDVVKIKNSSGGHIRLGEVLEISGFLLTNVVRTSLWFDGDTPNGTRPFAIALQDIPSTSINRAQVSGVCVALVNILDTDHGFAAVTAGEIVLQSATSGPLRILFKPTGTGEKICAVLFTDRSGLIGGCLAEDHPGRGAAFDVHLGNWNSSSNGWDYDSTATVKAIDWRYGVPYPPAGATGLFERRPSAEFGVIWETVALDCESPGGCGSDNVLWEGGTDVVLWEDGYLAAFESGA